ncbi:chaplin [Streptomyces sp. NPDC020096]
MSRIAKALVVTAATGMAVTGAAGVASANSGAGGAAIGSPGVLSGNVLQVPIDIPINLCGNTINAPGLLNPTFGNVCINGGFPEREERFHHHHGAEHED